MANLVRPAAIAGLAARDPGLSLGAHLNLTTGRPVLPASVVRSLVGQGGEFLPFGTLTRRAFAGRLVLGDVRAELEAQIAVLARAGVTIDHLDSHEHVHLLPGVIRAVVDVARSAGIRRIRTHRPALLPVDGRGSTLAYYRRHPRRVLTHGAKHLFAALLRREGFLTPDGMVGGALLLEPVAGGPRAEWDAICGSLPPGTWELVTHPADLGVPRRLDEAARLGELTGRRGAELEALTSPAFAAMVRARGVRLVSFAAVGDAIPIEEETHVARRA
jgi:predicted glycoside hydrolase/deacetylase ChbG (UPF0249 family)